MSTATVSASRTGATIRKGRLVVTSREWSFRCYSAQVYRAVAARGGEAMHFNWHMKQIPPTWLERGYVDFHAVEDNYLNDPEFASLPTLA